jgi:hypothetical protein
MLRRLSTAAQILVIVVVLLIGAAAWIFFHALDAGARLDAVHGDIVRIRADLVGGQDPSEDLRQAQADAKAANDDTHDPVWFAASWLPPLKTIRGLSSATDELASGALPSVVAVGTTIEPAALRIAPNRIALPPLRKAVPALTTADVALVRARDQVAGLPGGWGLLGDIREKVLGELTSLAGSIDDAARFARAGPTMLGGNGLRRYFVGIENNAESRATGGLVAAYAIVTADHGRIHVVRRGNDSQLQSFIQPRRTPVVPLSAEYKNVYGNFLPAQRWITSNLSPNFPDAARIWAHLWQVQSGKRVDGAFGVDPTALSAMLGAAGPVTVAGYPGVYNGANLAPFIESKQYVAFAGTSQAAQTARKDFVSKVAATVLRKLLSGSGSPTAITTALGRSAGAGHLALWSANSREQAQISGTPLAGELPSTTSPFASVSVNNATGSKLDYYLNRTLSYSARPCSGKYRGSTIAVTLENDAPLHGLPPYVRLRGDINHGQRLKVEKVPQNRLFVFIHATNGAALLGGTIDGMPAQFSQGVERNHATFGTELTLDPGAPRTIRLRLSEPVTPGVATTRVQPMARPQQTRLAVPACS